MFGCTNGYANDHHLKWNFRSRKEDLITLTLGNTYNPKRGIRRGHDASLKSIFGL